MSLLDEIGIPIDRVYALLVFVGILGGLALMILFSGED